MWQLKLQERVKRKRTKYRSRLGLVSQYGSRKGEETGQNEIVAEGTEISCFNRRRNILRKQWPSGSTVVKETKIIKLEMWMFWGIIHTVGNRRGWNDFLSLFKPSFCNLTLKNMRVDILLLMLSTRLIQILYEGVTPLCTDWFLKYCN